MIWRMFGRRTRLSFLPDFTVTSYRVGSCVIPRGCFSNLYCRQLVGRVYVVGDFNGEVHLLSLECPRHERIRSHGQRNFSILLQKWPKAEMDKGAMGGASRISRHHSHFSKNAATGGKYPILRA